MRHSRSSFKKHLAFGLPGALVATLLLAPSASAQTIAPGGGAQIMPPTDSVETNVFCNNEGVQSPYKLNRVLSWEGFAAPGEGATKMVFCNSGFVFNATGRYETTGSRRAAQFVGNVGIGFDPRLYSWMGGSYNQSAQFMPLGLDRRLHVVFADNGPMGDQNQPANPEEAARSQFVLQNVGTSGNFITMMTRPRFITYNWANTNLVAHLLRFSEGPWESLDPRNERASFGYDFRHGGKLVYYQFNNIPDGPSPYYQSMPDGTVRDVTLSLEEGRSVFGRYGARYGRMHVPKFWLHKDGTMVINAAPANARYPGSTLYSGKGYIADILAEGLARQATDNYGMPFEPLDPPSEHRSQHRALRVMFYNPVADGTNGQIVVDNLAPYSTAGSGINLKVRHPDASAAVQFSRGEWTSPTSGDDRGQIAFTKINGVRAISFNMSSPAGRERVAPFATGAKFWVERSGKTVVNADLEALPADQVALLVTGNIKANGTVTTSDLRLKKDIEPITDALMKVEQIKGVTYSWKDEAKGKLREAGVIAQDVEKVLPEVVRKDAEGTLSVDYGKMSGLLIEAIKELKAEVTAVKAENATLRAEVTALKK